MYDRPFIPAPIITVVELDKQAEYIWKILELKEE